MPEFGITRLGVLPRLGRICAAEKSSITSEDEEHIRELIEKNNDITIHEINEILNLGVCDETVRKYVVKMGFRYKKKSLHATERERSLCGSKKE